MTKKRKKDAISNEEAIKNQRRKNMNKNANKNLNEKLRYITKRLDMILVILLAKSGLKRKEVADVLEVSEKTIERMLPFEKLKRRKE